MPIMHKNRSVNVDRFAMVPRADIPRATFNAQHTHKTTFDAAYLVPIYVDEVLPGDHIKLHLTAFARLITPIAPVMDNLHLETFFFFVPNRLVWTNWVKFMGEQTNPGDSIVYTIPQMVSPAGGYAALSLQDYFGLPTAGTYGVGAGNTVTHSALPLRSYNLIYREWFRDENLINSPVVDTGDAASTYTDYVLLKRGKRKDYFTGALPWPQKGTAVTSPLGTTAPVSLSATTGVDQLIRRADTHALAAGVAGFGSAGGTAAWLETGGSVHTVLDPNGTLYADLSAATAATINQIRLAFQTQKLLERDARGGTRYTEIIRSHFGVTSPDSRLQRPEYLGGGHTMVTISPIAQTSGTSASGTTTPMGTLAAAGGAVAHGHGFSYAATEHGHIIGLANVRADLTYQQGMHRMWSRSTRYDFYFPAFAMLGEQPIYNKEIYCRGDSNDGLVFGYQERWAEYRYKPSRITGLFRSTNAAPLDIWHYAEKFTSLPTLNSTFITDPSQSTVARSTAVASPTGQQLLFDGFFNVDMTRPIPMFSVPGLVDHF